MNDLPQELCNAICNYLIPYELLHLSVCAKSSNVFSFFIERNKCKKEVCANILLKYMAIGPLGKNNPIYNDEDDLEIDLSSWEMLLPSEKIEQAFEYLTYFSETFMEDYGFPMYSFYRYTTYKQIRPLFTNRYKKSRFALSRLPWDADEDKSAIIDKEDYISVIYNIKSPSRQMRCIMKSPTLKSLIG